MKMLTRWVVVGALAFTAGCWSGKRGPRGSNTGVGSDGDYDGPWTQGGGTQAAVTTPQARAHGLPTAALPARYVAPATRNKKR